jgi:hypothetical protein
MTYLRNKERRARRDVARWLAGAQERERKAVEQRRFEENLQDIYNNEYLELIKQKSEDKNEIALLTFCVYALKGRGDAGTLLKTITTIIEDVSASAWRAMIVDEYSGVTGVVSYTLELRFMRMAMRYVKPFGFELRGSVDRPREHRGYIDIPAETYAVRMTSEAFHYNSIKEICALLHTVCREVKTLLTRVQ